MVHARGSAAAKVPAGAAIVAGLVAAFVIGAPASRAGRRAVGVTVFTPALMLRSAGRLARHLADRHRLAAWKAHWRAAGPKWSRHR